MGRDVLCVHDAADQRSETRRRLLIRQQVELAFLDIANARSEAEAEEVAEAEHVICHTTCVGVVLLNRQSRIVKRSRSRTCGASLAVAAITWYRTARIGRRCGYRKRRRARCHGVHSRPRLQHLSRQHGSIARQMMMCAPRPIPWQAEAPGAHRSA